MICTNASSAAMHVHLNTDIFSLSGRAAKVIRPPRPVFANTRNFSGSVMREMS